MSAWLISLHVFTFVWLSAWAARATVNITSKNRRSASFLVLVFFVFYGVPILLDIVMGVPEYAFTPGLRYGATSETTNAVYDLFVMSCPVFWWYTSRSFFPASRYLVVSPGRRAQRVLYLLLASPLLALVFAPQRGVYLRYAAILGNNLSGESRDYYAIIATLTVISLAAGVGLLLIHRNFVRALFLILPFMALAMWLQGKRSIVALGFLLIWTAAWMRGFLTRSRAITFGILCVIAFAGYVAWYEATFRPDAVANSYSTYENSRIDYGRDHDLKSAIFCELDDSDKILDYRGQSMLFDLTMYVPRSVWPDKPWPYPMYLTAYALQIQTQREELETEITTSLLDEAVANFGWAGLLLGPVVFALLCRVCDHSPDPLVKVVGVLLACLFLTVNLSAFMPLMLAWFLYLGWSWYVLSAPPRGLGTLRALAVPR